jgi:hypothetical protein
MGFFELRTPSDVLAKAHREFARLSASLDIDNVFDVLVTAYHIQDYLRGNSAVPQVTSDAFLQDQDIQDCRDLCNKGRHVRLTRGGRSDPSTGIWRGTLNSAPLNTLPLNSTEEKWVVYIGIRVLDVQALAGRVIAKWNAFFVATGLRSPPSAARP